MTRQRIEVTINQPEQSDVALEICSMYVATKKQGLCWAGSARVVVTTNRVDAEGAVMFFEDNNIVWGPVSFLKRDFDIRKMTPADKVVITGLAA